jgi:hypothetical protein
VRLDRVAGLGGARPHGAGQLLRRRPHARRWRRGQRAGGALREAVRGDERGRLERLAGGGRLGPNVPAGAGRAGLGSLRVRAWPADSVVLWDGSRARRLRGSACPARAGAHPRTPPSCPRARGLKAPQSTLQSAGGLKTARSKNLRPAPPPPPHAPSRAASPSLSHQPPSRGPVGPPTPPTPQTPTTAVSRATAPLRRRTTNPRGGAAASAPQSKRRAPSGPPGRAQAGGAAAPSTRSGAQTAWRGRGVGRRRGGGCAHSGGRCSPRFLSAARGPSPARACPPAHPPAHRPTHPSSLAQSPPSRGFWKTSPSISAAAGA